jgi:hypothetical protein
MWFPARGKLAVNGAFGNVGVPPATLRPDLVNRPDSPESGSAVVDGALRGVPHLGHGRSRVENFP